MLSSLIRSGCHRPVNTLGTPGALTLCRYRTLVISRNKIGDELLDFVTAGPKLRKWYGAGERPTDGGEQQEPEKPEIAADVVLVTEADSPIGEQVVLQLILARQQLRLLVRDVAAAKIAYGPYASPLPAADPVGPRTLRGVKCLVLLGRPARGLLEAARAAGVGHVVLLAAAPEAGPASGGFSLGGLFGGSSAQRELRDLADAAVEAAVKAAGLPYSIVQVYGLLDPGAASSGSLTLMQQQQQGRGRSAAAAGGGSGSDGGGGAGGRGVGREALGALISGLVDAVPQRGRTLTAQAPPSKGGRLSSASPEEQQQEVATALLGLLEDP